jgi:creatinine amidohydrolase
MSNNIVGAKNYWMQNLHWKDVEQYLKSNESVLIPIGQTEEHGPHLPMGADTITAMGLAETVAERTNTLIAPPVWYGWAPRMLGFPGSFTLRATTLTDLMYDICVSLIHHGFTKIFIINGHRRENLPPLEIACAKVRYETNAQTVIFDPLYLGVETVLKLRDGNTNILSHAAGIETAHMLYLVPELVNKQELKRLSEGPSNFAKTDQCSIIDRPVTYDTINEFINLRGSEGVKGDVAWGTFERGELYHNAIVDSIVNYIEKFKKIPTVITNKPTLV